MPTIECGANKKLNTTSEVILLVRAVHILFPIGVGGSKRVEHAKDLILAPALVPFLLVRKVFFVDIVMSIFSTGGTACVKPCSS
jgi:hypothetical protein